MGLILGSNEIVNGFSVLPCAAVIFRFDGYKMRLSWANDSFFELFGCTKDDYLNIMPNDNGFRMLGREYSVYMIDKIKSLIDNCDTFTFSLEASSLNGSKISLFVEAVSVPDGDDCILNCIVHSMDEISETAEKKSSMNSLLFEVMSISADWIMNYSENDKMFKLFKNVGGNFTPCMETDDFEQFFKSGGMVYEEDEETFDQLCTNIKSGIDKGIFEMRLILPNDNDFRWYRITVKTVRDKLNSEYVGSVGRIEDISGIKNANQRLIEKAERDPLTKLYNKSATKSIIKNYLRSDSRDTLDAFIIVDIDNFKQVNDTLGHLYGDSLLVALSEEMQDLFRSNDVIGRIGGDEFIVFLRGIKQHAHIASKADDLCKIFKLLNSEDEGVKISGSLGIALFPTDGDTFDELYRKADIALYTSKRAGKSCYNFYKAGAEIPSENKSVPRVERYQSSMDFLAGAAGFDGDILGSAFEMAENGVNMNDAINLILSKTGKHFNFSRIAVSETTDDGHTFKDSFIWNSKNTLPAHTDSFKFPVKDLNDFCSSFDKNFIFDINVVDDCKLKDNIYISYLRANKIKSTLVGGYFKGGRMIGMVSFQESTFTGNWSIEAAKSLKELTRIVFSYLIKLRDFDDAKEAADYSMNYDYLTGLMNYSYFKRRSNEYILSSFGTDKLALLVADFSNFSYINNKYGFEAGNTLLRSFANALKYFSSKVKCACRLDADKYCALAIYDDDLIGTFDSFIKHFATDERIIGGQTSFGIASGAFIFDVSSGISFDNAFDNANLALKYSKKHTLGKCTIYKPEMREDLNRSVEIASDAKRALLNGEFKVFFQPKVSINSKEIVGAEALVRWVKPNGTIVPPDSFVPLLEKNGFIVKIDYFVYEEVCRYLRNRIDNGEKVVPVSVNVSRIHMLADDFVETIISIVRKYRIDTSIIELELTESVFLANEDDAVSTIEKLKEFGFKVSIDDFGSGYSSLALLKKMPVDVLKIDKSLLSDNPGESRDGIVLSSVIDMADKMDISIVCEGVETAEQVDFLRENNCDMVQGFYFAKPVPSSDFEEMLDNGISD